MNKFLFLLLLFCTSVFSQEKTQSALVYKKLIDNNNVNFYIACDSSESYFKTINKDLKGSGYNFFKRWKHENEYKYFPSGNRIIDFSLPYREYNRIKENENRIKNRNVSSTGWTSLGPDNINTITGNYNSGLGRIEVVEVNPLNPQQIYLGTRSGGFWKTNNEGASWTNTTDFLPASGVNTLAVSPLNFEDLLVNVQMANTGYSFGVYHSVDGGTTFEQTNFNPDNLGFGGLGSDFKINIIKYHQNVPGLVFIGTNKGIYKSIDNLQTWTVVNSSCNVRDIEFHPTSDNIIYFYEDSLLGGNDRKIFISTNQGDSYVATGNIVQSSYGGVDIAVTPNCPDCIFISTYYEIYKSVDAGLNFNVVNITPGSNTFSKATPSDLDQNIIIAGYIDLARSNNAGVTFNKATWWSLGSSQHGGTNYQSSYTNSQVYIHADCNYIKCINGVFYACTDGFLSKSSDNGLTWQKLTFSNSIRENYNLGISQSNHFKIVTGSQDNGTSIKSESGWLDFFGGDGFDAIVHPLNNNFIIGSYQFGGRIKSTDGGYSLSGVTPTGMSADWSSPQFYDPNDQMTVYTVGRNVYKSINFGTTWTNLGAPFGGGIVYDASIAQNDSRRMVFTYQEKIVLSTDGGLTFTSIKNNLPNFYITDVAFDPKNDETIIVTYGSWENNNQKIYITHNSGGLWQNITYNLGSMPILSVVIDNTEDSIIYLGAEIGVYKKAMNSNNWELFNVNLPNVAIKELEINHGSNTLNAASWGRGLWKCTLSNRQDYPKIINTFISNTPNDILPEVTMPQYVSSKIEYQGTLSDVRVYWSINTPDFNSTNTIPMSLDVNNTWVSNTQIPDFPEGTKVFFKVVAIGSNSDTSETYKFMYKLKPMLAVDNFYDSREVKIFPNPTNDFLNIEIPKNLDKINFEIIDVLGQKVFADELINRTVIKTNEFSSGIYFIKFYYDNKVRILKIIKE